jgi:hypothetical protein
VTPTVRQGHTGAAAGTFSEYVYFPAHGVGFVILANSRISGEAVFGRLDALMTDFVLAGAKDPPAPGVTLSEAQMKSYEGFYEADNPQDRIYALRDALIGNMDIKVENGALHAHPYTSPIDFALVPLGGGKFYAKGQEVDASAILGRDDLGRDVLSLSDILIPGSHAVRVDSLWPKVRVWSFVAATAVTLSSLLWALIWIPWALIRRLRRKPGVAVLTRLAPLAASSCFLIMLYTFATISGWKWAFPSPEAVRFWLAGWGLALFSLMSVVVLIRARSNAGRSVRAYDWIVTVVCSGLAIYLYHWQLLGFESWTYQ